MGGMEYSKTPGIYDEVVKILKERSGWGYMKGPTLHTDQKWFAY